MFFAVKNTKIIDEVHNSTMGGILEFPRQEVRNFFELGRALERVDDMVLLAIEYFEDLFVCVGLVTAVLDSRDPSLGLLRIISRGCLPPIDTCLPRLAAGFIGVVFRTVDEPPTGRWAINVSIAIVICS